MRHHILSSNHGYAGGLKRLAALFAAVGVLAVLLVVPTGASAAPGDQDQWFLAEGTIDWGFSLYITIENPNNQVVHVNVTYMTEDGPVNGGQLTLPAMSHTTIWDDVIWEALHGAKDFSSKFVCVEGLDIAVDRTMYWTGDGAASPEGHSSVGATSPMSTWYLPEGSSQWGFETWLTIQNPNETAADCTVTYMPEGGTAVPVPHSVPARSRRTYSMFTDVGSMDASIKVDSPESLPVICERSMYRNKRRGGHESMGTSNIWRTAYLAEGTTSWGFTTYVVIQNPNGVQNDVTVTYMTPSGPVTHPEDPIMMPPYSRKTIRVNDYLAGRDFSTRVNGTYAVVAERAMYWDNGTGEACHDSIGTVFPHSKWYLPDGWTGWAPAMNDTYETYTTVQNPNTVPVDVVVTYLTYNGVGNVTFTDTIAPASRVTYPMSEHITNNKVAVLVESLTTGRHIIVERSMYWHSRGAGTNTIGGHTVDTI